MGHSGATYARRPPAVGPGDRVGVAALSGGVEPERVDAGLQTLRELGFEPVVATNARTGPGRFAGSDGERLDGFHELAADPGVRAIFFARGGHGVLRILDRLDWRLIGRHPRAYVGYSDLTPFLLEVVRRFGLVAFHGPMAAVDLAGGLSEREEASLLGALSGETPPVGVTTLGDPTTGVVEAPLLGGCLSLLAATLGTEYRPRVAGSILFWEDVSEPLYRLDRMMHQMRLAGGLTGIRAMVVGKIEPTDTDPDGSDLRSWLEEVAGALGLPVAIRCPSGHCRPNLTLPLGAAARLDPARGELRFPSERSSR